MRKTRKKPSGVDPAKKEAPKQEKSKQEPAKKVAPVKTEPKKEPVANKEPAGEEKKAASKKPDDKKPKIKPVEIGFDGIRERIHRIAIPNSYEGGLFWSHDSKKLAFRATIDGKRGTYTVALPEELKPKLLTTQTGSNAKWISSGNQILWLSKGVPTSLAASTGKATSYSFSVRQATDVAALLDIDRAWAAIGVEFPGRQTVLADDRPDRQDSCGQVDQRQFVGEHLS